VVGQKFTQWAYFEERAGTVKEGYYRNFEQSSKHPKTNIITSTKDQYHRLREEDFIFAVDLYPSLNKQKRIINLNNISWRLFATLMV